MQRPVQRVTQARPVPESTFISAVQVLMNQSQPSSSINTIQQGELAKKLLALKKQRDKEVEDKKQALLAARREEQQKKAEGIARKRHEQAEKKAAVAARKMQSTA